MGGFRGHVEKSTAEENARLGYFPEFCRREVAVGAVVSAVHLEQHAVFFLSESVFGYVRSGTVVHILRFPGACGWFSCDEQEPLRWCFRGLFSSPRGTRLAKALVDC